MANYYKGARAANTVQSNSKEAYHSASSSVKDAWNDMPTYRDLRESEAVTSAMQGATSGWQSLKKAVWGGDGDPSGMKRSASGTPSVTSMGHTANNSSDSTWGKLVGTVVEASNKVTRVVNRDAGYESDEDGYKGTSHLSRIITEYHMNKARTIDDLPDWLRREQQQQGGGGVYAESASRAWDSRPLQASRSMPVSSPYDHRSADSGGRGSGLRDIYDQAATSNLQSLQSHGRQGSASTANDRLRQLRDQKQRSRLEATYAVDPGSRPTPQGSYGDRNNDPSAQRGSDREYYGSRSRTGDPRQSETPPIRSVQSERPSRRAMYT